MLFPIVAFLPYMCNRNSSNTYLHAYNVFSLRSTGVNGTAVVDRGKNVICKLKQAYP